MTINNKNTDHLPNSLPNQTTQFPNQKINIQQNQFLEENPYYRSQSNPNLIPNYQNQFDPKFDPKIYSENQKKLTRNFDNETGLNEYNNRYFNPESKSNSNFSVDENFPQNTFQNPNENFVYPDYFQSIEPSAPLMNSFERKNWQESTDQMYSNSIEPQSNVESYQVYSPSFDSKNPQFKKDQKN
eukprot:Anaeramoba_ignava/a115476_10.p1 GENE.a115476_10~~a115476_10.p1  ORF type:complete len:185 (+),score=87.34 a115476_10:218-772(+)